MSAFASVQDQVEDWTRHNFPDAPAWQPLLGAGEELGELFHAFLKREQGIRLNEPHDLNIQDALGDIIIYLMHFCNIEGIDLEQAVLDTWYKTVAKRDWRPDGGN